MAQPTANTRITALEERVTQLEELVKALTANQHVVNRPAVEPVGTYPHTAPDGRKYRICGPGQKAFEPKGA